MRWRHPTRGAVSPAEFIPVAEQSGVIMELGAIALRQACQDAMTWRSPVRVAVNLSPVQFRDPKLVALVAEILDQSGLPASRLKLEITETVLLEDNATNLEVLHQLKELGVLIVLDDFGTGYSSLGYLQRFPFDKLKINQSFVRPLIERPESQAIVRSILHLARALGIDTTAEGVETQEQLQWLVREGCGQIQGYMLGRPMPAGDVNRFLQDFACPTII
jgi:EAL domain-containing protein (putative c-di-GMP-specific phosphodiesterase class I)